MTIWKYPIPVEDSLILEIPEGGEILSVMTQNGEAQMWVRVDPSRTLETRRFRVVGTGHAFPS